MAYSAIYYHDVAPSGSSNINSEAACYALCLGSNIVNSGVQIVAWYPTNNYCQCKTVPSTAYLTIKPYAGYNNMVGNCAMYASLCKKYFLSLNV